MHQVRVVQNLLATVSGIMAFLTISEIIPLSLKCASTIATRNPELARLALSLSLRVKYDKLHVTYVLH